MAPMPTRCLLMRNMFDPATERNPNFDVVISSIDWETSCVEMVGAGRKSKKT